MKISGIVKTNSYLPNLNKANLQRPLIARVIIVKLWNLKTIILLKFLRYWALQRKKCLNRVHWKCIFKDKKNKRIYSARLRACYYLDIIHIEVPNSILILAINSHKSKTRIRWICKNQKHYNHRSWKVI